MQAGPIGTSEEVPTLVFSDPRAVQRLRWVSTCV